MVLNYLRHTITGFLTVFILSGGTIPAAFAGDTVKNPESRHHETITINDGLPVPLQIGRAARRIDKSAAGHIKIIALTPRHHGIQSRTIEIIRKDLARAIKDHHGSAEEIWQRVSFSVPEKQEQTALSPENTKPSGFKTNLILDNRIGRQANEDGLAYRTSLQAGFRGNLAPHVMVGADLRLNIADNLSHHDSSYSKSNVRRNIGAFTSQKVGADRLYISWLGNIGKDASIALTAGYLEEMYGGFGGEVLYRPFRKTYALGLEGYQAYKRAANHDLDIRLTGDSVTSFHAKGWYRFPHADITLHGRIGRYLGEDWGGTLALQKQMANGSYIEAAVTATDASEDALLTGNAHIAGSLAFHVPFSAFGKAGKDSRSLLALSRKSGVHTAIQTIGRDAGQIIAPPVSLYEITEPLLYRHLGNQWPSLLH